MSPPYHTSYRLLTSSTNRFTDCRAQNITYQYCRHHSPGSTSLHRVNQAREYDLLFLPIKLLCVQAGSLAHCFSLLWVSMTHSLSMRNIMGWWRKIMFSLSRWPYHLHNENNTYENEEGKNRRQNYTRRKTIKFPDLVFVIGSLVLSADIWKLCKKSFSHCCYLS